MGKTTNTIQTLAALAAEYGKYIEEYGDGKRFFTLATKLEIFRKLYPKGTIVVSIPEKDAFAEGVVCKCSVFADAANRETTLLAESFARRVTSQVQDDEIDVFAAARAAAISSALSLAGIELPVEMMCPKDSSENDASDEVSVAATPKKRVRSMKTRESKITEELSEDGAPIPESTSDTVPAEPASEGPESEPEKETAEASADETTSDEPVEATEETEVSDETTAVEPSDVEEVIEESEDLADEEDETEDEESEEDSDDEGESEDEEAEVEEESDEESPELSALNALIQETGMSYEDALNYSFQHQTRKGVYGDLLVDESSRALLVWFSKENGMFSKKNPKASQIARIIVLHDNLA